MHGLLSLRATICAVSSLRRCFTSVDPVLDRLSQRQINGGRALASFLPPTHPTQGSTSTPVKPPRLLYAPRGSGTRHHPTSAPHCRHVGGLPGWPCRVAHDCKAGALREHTWITGGPRSSPVGAERARG